MHPRPKALTIAMGIESKEVNAASKFAFPPLFDGNPGGVV
jgi:hypothetical protein